VAVRDSYVSVNSAVPIFAVNKFVTSARGTYGSVGIAVSNSAKNKFAFMLV
jgi:hypothetical protein